MSLTAPVAPPPPGGRGASIVTGYGMFRNKTVRVCAVAGGGCLAVALVAFAGYNAMQGEPERPARADDPQTTLAQTVASPPVPEAVKPAPPPPPPSPQVVEKVVYVNATPPPTFADIKIEDPPATVAPAFVSVSFPAESGEGRFAVPPPVPKDNRIPQGTGGGSLTPSATAQEVEKTRVAFKGTSIAGGLAGAALRQTYLMLPTFIPCTLQVAMDTTLPGAIMCEVAMDMLSPERVKLLPSGSRVVGTYKSDLHPGQNRLFAFAGSAFTPDGVPVPLDAGIADGMGRSGIPATIDNHYPERYGAAVFLTGAETAASIMQSMMSRGGNQYFNLGGGSGGSSGIATLTQEILRTQGTIPATGTVPPGTLVMLVIDHPISFEHAYKVRNRK